MLNKIFLTSKNKTFFFTLTKCLGKWRQEVKPFKREPHKMVKHCQTIRWFLPKNCLSVVDHFLGLVLKRVKLYKIWDRITKETVSLLKSFAFSKYIKKI